MAGHEAARWPATVVAPRRYPPRSGGPGRGHSHRHPGCILSPAASRASSVPNETLPLVAPGGTSRAYSPKK
jgi:hypothetical protein